MKVVKKAGVTMKIWDLGGQQKYRSEWSRYSRGSDVIVFVVDTQAPDELPVARRELHMLLEDRELARLPLLVIANKIDLGPKFTEAELIKGLNLGQKRRASMALHSCRPRGTRLSGQARAACMHSRCHDSCLLCVCISQTTSPRLRGWWSPSLPSTARTWTKRWNFC